MTPDQPTAANANARATATGATVSVVDGYCINLRGRIDACDLCSRVCHAGAIALGSDTVAIDPDRCVGCGACVPACPAGVFTHDRFDPETLPGLAVANGAARIACAASEGDDAGTSVIPCHRMTDARLLAAVFAAGAEQIDIVGTENCARCPGGDARPALTVAVRTLGKWFGAAAPLVCFVSDGRDDEAQETRRAVERRHLLGGIFRAFSAASEPETDLPGFDDPRYLDDPAEAIARPVPYQRLIATCRSVLPFRPDGLVGATGRSIDEECSGCMVCAELCPTGALGGAFGDDVESRQRVVSFDPALCTNCTLCLKICPMEAISARALHGVAEATSGRTVLFARTDRICTECGALFPQTPGSPEICPSCENDKHMDEDWTEMLGG
jgi:NAD-dependent dihydropyrimidine dehydrogenase PreA subunit